MANPNGGLNETLQYFVNRVEQLSHRTLRVVVVDSWGNFADDAEELVVGDVSSGKADLGWASAWAFDDSGVTAFRALQAPMLIDSYAVEKAVIKRGIPDEMMRALDHLGLAGLGVLAGDLSKTVAKDHPLLGPSDWQGITFWPGGYRRQAEAVRALGVSAIGGANDAFETSLRAYAGHQDRPSFPFVTANLNLWPEMDVLLANPGRIARLTGEQKAWLARAAKEAAGRSVELVGRDAQILVSVCKEGSRFANVSDADLKKLRALLDPVYIDLQEDPATKDFIEQIENVKRSTPPEPALPIPADCRFSA
jgi:TRAP-type C4-dicarboxylate transport system substrate-binding protein